MDGLRDRMSRVPQVQPEKRRLVADLPAEVQLNAINQIMSGQRTTNQHINTFVQKMASQGMQPEQIRQAFIAEQRKSPNPLIIIS